MTSSSTNVIPKLKTTLFHNWENLFLNPAL